MISPYLLSNKSATCTGAWRDFGTEGSRKETWSCHWKDLSSYVLSSRNTRNSCSSYTTRRRHGSEGGFSKLFFHEDTVLLNDRKMQFSVRLNTLVLCAHYTCAALDQCRKYLIMYLIYCSLQVKLRLKTHSSNVQSVLDTYKDVIKVVSFYFHSVL